MVDYYNLEMIIAIGFRVRSRRGSQFRKWAADRLSEYLVKGFVLDDERLKGNAGIVDYFDELLARIREIRASEARVYLMLRNIFSLASDYQEGEKQTKLFFAAMQNKMHYAATGQTAAEIIKARVDGQLPNSGLTNWKGSRVLKSDIGVAKNYLLPNEIDTLNRITVMFLDQAEFRAQRRQTIRMADWEIFLDKFLADVELPVLAGAGSVTHQQAQDYANEQYDLFAHRRAELEQQQAEQNYIEDLKTAALTLKQNRKHNGDE
ncbi:MAG: virulence RhuM family protein [Sedimentisphaerales bacterium]|nr:virulence RhuM family protein [Sedimentisphaerales bacterium]